MGIPVLGWCVAAILFWLGPWNVGFLSTDYDILRTASRARWFQPLEEHHWSLLITSLFRATAAGLIGRPVWIALAFAGHCLNIALAWRLLLRWGTARNHAAFITILWALCPAGFEAMAWSCAVGYVLVTTVILMSLAVVLRPGITASTTARWQLAALQILALLVWDWGVLLTPIVALSLALHLRAWDHVRADLKRGVPLLLPATACWCAALMVKAVLGHSLGYAVGFSPARTAYLMVSAPLRTIYPNGPTPFYRSVPGLSVALLLIAALAIRSAVDRRVATASALFVLCQIPYVLWGAPESRYFYMAAPFFYAGVVHAVSRLRGRTPLVVGAILVSTHGFWAVERAALWKGAYREARRIKVAIESLMEPPRDRKVVVNLPDRYGPGEMMWRPPLWRDGLCAFRGRIVRVNTMDAPFTWADSGIPIMDRAEILRTFARHDVIEVAYATPGQWRDFEIKVLHHAKRHAPHDRREANPGHSPAP